MANILRTMYIYGRLAIKLSMVSSDFHHVSISIAYIIILWADNSHDIACGSEVGRNRMKKHKF